MVFNCCESAEVIENTPPLNPIVPNVDKIDPIPTVNDDATVDSVVDEKEEEQAVINATLPTEVEEAGENAKAEKKAYSCWCLSRDDEAEKASQKASYNFCGLYKSMC